MPTGNVLTDSAIKDVLVPAVLGTVSEDAVRVACAIAGVHQAHVAGLVSIGVPTLMATPWGDTPAGVYDSLLAAANESAAALAARFRALFALQPVASEVRVADAYWLSPPEIAALHARYADLVVVGRTAEGAPELEAALFADLLFGAGRPVLLVPARAPWQDAPARVVIAWQPTREASRALHDALPFLRAAAAGDLLVVEPRVGARRHGELPGADIATHLARHGIAVSVVAQPLQGDSVGAAILRHVEQSGAQLLVAGGYGHARLREQVFGGVTRTLFEQAAVPVLFSH
jgi:nucleotide-binding universal stress UspA family protein